ncbi:MAG: hypothetical protein RL701_6429 [Pseudomonadota bacterium]|jgi:hypothetical protein
MPDARVIPVIPARIGAERDNLLGVVIAADANATTLEFHSPKAFPPGQPVELTLWPEGDSTLKLQLRSMGSKLCAPELFSVRARIVNLPRGARARLLQALQEA